MEDIMERGWEYTCFQGTQILVKHIGGQQVLLWAVAALVLVVGASIIAVVVGSRLPQRHSVSRMVHLNRPQNEVWEIITNFADQASWRPELLSVVRIPSKGNTEFWKEMDRDGQSRIFETMESIPLHRLVRRIVDEDLAFGESWTMEIAKFGEVTSLTITEDLEVYSPVLRIITRVISGPRDSIDVYLRAVGNKMGLNVKISGV